MSETPPTRPNEGTEQPQSPAGMSGKQSYNVVADTVGGVNVRWKDNLFQALAIFVCLILGAGIGALVVEERMMGVIAGGFIGLIVGLFGSGIFLMIFRALRHLKGRHD